MADHEVTRRTGAPLALMAMTLANAMILIDQTAMPLALPDVMSSLGVGSAAAQWVLTCSLLPLAGLLVLGGRLGDLAGRRRVFIAGAVLFVGASAVGGAAPVLAVLLVARVLQGVGGALMLPASVAIVSDAYPASSRGRALGTMGGLAAMAGALGPTIGGLLTSALSWRAVLFVDAPLAALCILATLRAVPADERRTEPAHIDLAGTALLCLALVGLVFGLSEAQATSWTSTLVMGAFVSAGIAGLLFVRRQRRSREPLVDFELLRSRRNYLGATTSQFICGVAEMGLGIIFPLFLVLNLGMSPVLAGVALIPTTLPMVVVAPLAGRWYDRHGGRPPLVVGFAPLGASGVAMAVAVGEGSYAAVLPGLLIYGIGLALVLTVNDPVSLDMVPPAAHGQASGVSATAEQGGGAVGIALLYTVFHTCFVGRLNDIVDRSPIPNLDRATNSALTRALTSAEAVGLKPDQFDAKLQRYLTPARQASEFGYTAVFVTVAVLAALGAVAASVLVRRPSDAPAEVLLDTTFNPPQPALCAA